MHLATTMRDVILLVDDEERYRRKCAELLAPKLPDGWSFEAPAQLNEVEHFLRSHADRVRIALLDHSINSGGFQADKEVEAMEYGVDPSYMSGYELARNIQEQFPHIVCVGFTKGGVLNMGGQVRHLFKDKRYLTDMDENGAKARVEFQEFLGSLIQGALV